MVLPPAVPGARRVDTADRAGIMSAGERHIARVRREAVAAHAARGSRSPTRQALFGSAGLPA